MARLKSKYREYRDGGRVDQPGQEELPIEPPAEAPADAPPVDSQPETPAESQPEQPPQPQHDDATLALKQQIEGLRQSEAMQRQQHAQEAMPQQQPMTREQRLAAWQQHGGLSDSEVAFFQRNPLMVDFPELTGAAVNQARQAGHARGTDEHFAAVEKIFNANLNHLQQAAQQPAMQTPAATPKFFKPPPAARSPSGIVSAPVSREVPNSSGQRIPPRGQVKLTPVEVEAARISGVTIEEYAREKLKYEGMKAAGEYRDNRDQR